MVSYISLRWFLLLIIVFNLLMYLQSNRHTYPVGLDWIVNRKLGAFDGDKDFANWKKIFGKFTGVILPWGCLEVRGLRKN